MSELDRSVRPTPCCREAENMQVEVIDEQRFIEHCSTCQSRHFVMVVPPIPFGLAGNSI